MEEKKNLFKRYIDIDEEKLIKYVIDHQENGGWAEEIKNTGGNVPSPLVTSRMVIGLIPFLRLETYGHLKDRLAKSIKTSLEKIVNSFHEGGWSDHSGGPAIVDATGAALTAIVDAISEKLIDHTGLENIIYQGYEFLLEQQNSEDGGWSLGKGGDSKIQYTYWALKAIKTLSESEIEKKDLQLEKSIGKGIKWLTTNLHTNKDKGFSITIGGDMGAVVTAFGIELLEDFSISYDKNKIIESLKNTQIRQGCWETQTDPTTVSTIPRRLYVFSDTPCILECLAFLGVEYGNILFTHVLSNIKNLECSEGGFKYNKDQPFPTGWFVAEVLKMISSLITKFNSMFEKYEKSLDNGFQIKKHSFSKAVLMIGRWQPPHLGHFFGLKAILYGDEAEFFLPGEALQEIVNIDKVFLGIARVDITKDNPIHTGEVREIWRQIIDNDEELRKMSNMIEIVTCPAKKDMTNVVDAIYELTYMRDSIIVASGNPRVAEQCRNNNIKNFLFKRSDSNPSGTEIRNLISKINFDNLSSDSNLIELRQKLHPAAFQIMLQDDIFKKAALRIKGR